MNNLTQARYRGKFGIVFDYMESDNIDHVVDNGNGMGTTIFFKEPVHIFQDCVDTISILISYPEHKVIEAFVDTWGLDWVNIGLN